jgi:hypothetical protein
MKSLLDAGVLPGLLEIHVNVDWGRFLVSMIVIGCLLGYMVYSFMKR